MPYSVGINDEWINSSVDELYCFNIRWEGKIRKGEEKQNIQDHKYIRNYEKLGG